MTQALYAHMNKKQKKLLLKDKKKHYPTTWLDYNRASV
jgi:hypothetical protein